MSESHSKGKGNRFAALSDLADSSDSSDSEQEVETKQVEQKGVRTWNIDAPKRSPRFSKPKQELHFLPDEPLRMTVQEGLPPILTNATVYPSLMERGAKTEQESVVAGGTEGTERGSATCSSGAERGSAMAWAEKVKQSLEKAEAARKPAAPYQPSEDFIASLGKLSFFRRGASEACNSKDQTP